jgi:hypothetical protein
MVEKVLVLSMILRTWVHISFGYIARVGIPLDKSDSCSVTCYLIWSFITSVYGILI